MSLMVGKKVRPTVDKARTAQAQVIFPCLLLEICSNLCLIDQGVEGRLKHVSFLELSCWWIFLGICGGVSGNGKVSLLHVLSGIEPMSEGEISRCWSGYHGESAKDAAECVSLNGNMFPEDDIRWA